MCGADDDPRHPRKACQHRGDGEAAGFPLVIRGRGRLLDGALLDAPNEDFLSCVFYVFKWLSFGSDVVGLPEPTQNSCRCLGPFNTITHTLEPA